MTTEVKRDTLRKELHQARKRRAARACAPRSQKQCVDECLWRPGLFGAGECTDSDLLSQFIDAVCDPRFLKQTLGPREARNIAKFFGYTVQEFNKEQWVEVSKRELCTKLRTDARRIRKATTSSEPWEALGMSKKAYDELVAFAAIQYARGKTLPSTLDSIRKYATKKNLYRGVRLSAVLLAVVLAAATLVPEFNPAGPKAVVGTPAELKLFREGSLDIEAVPTEQFQFEESALNPRITDPQLVQNSILDKFDSQMLMSGDVSIDPLKDTISSQELTAELGRTAEILSDKELCEFGVDLELGFLEATLASLEDSLKDSDNLTDFSDFKNWGLLPGQQLYYGGAFGVQGLTHHAIYLGDGVVLEVGSGPKACKTSVDRNNLLSFKNQMVGLSTIPDFVRRAVKNKSPVHIVSTPQDADLETVSRRLSRAREVVGCWDYNAITNNCESVANYISFGVRQSKQSEMIVQIARLITIGSAALNILLRLWKKPYQEYKRGKFLNTITNKDVND